MLGFFLAMNPVGSYLPNQGLNLHPTPPPPALEGKVLATGHQGSPQILDYGSQTGLQGPNYSP